MRPGTASTRVPNDGTDEAVNDIGSRHEDVHRLADRDDGGIVDG